mgnify:CR=1 FL=1
MAVGVCGGRASGRRGCYADAPLRLLPCGRGVTGCPHDPRRLGGLEEAATPFPQSGSSTVQGPAPGPVHRRRKPPNRTHCAVLPQAPPTMCPAPAIGVSVRSLKICPVGIRRKHGTREPCVFPCKQLNYLVNGLRRALLSRGLPGSCTYSVCFVITAIEKLETTQQPE